MGSVVLGTTAVLLAALPVAEAQQPEASRTIEGDITNGTDATNTSSGLTAVLHREGPTGHDHLEAVADAEGHFRFGDIEYDAEALYAVSVKYKGALYGSDLDLSEGSPPPLSLTVYEASASPTLLSVPAASFLIEAVDKASQTLWALEIVKVKNDTDTTYVPGPEPMSLLRFSLPDGAQGLQVDTGLMGADVLQVDRGFALTAAVPPGEHEVLYAYHFPYSGSEIALGKSLPYGAESVRVLVPYGVVGVSSDQLGEPEVVNVIGRSYDLLKGSDLPRGSRLSLDLRGLPEASFRDRLDRRIEEVRLEYVAPAGLGLLMAGLIAFALWRRGVGRRVPSPAVVGRGLENADRSAVMEAIARLDEDFEQGSLGEEEYRRKCAALAAQVAARSGHRRTSLD